MAKTQAEPAKMSRPDPRPSVFSHDDGSVRLAGSRCKACAYPNSELLERCPICAGECEPAEFGPGGVVFAATVLRVPVPGRMPPYGLAYINIDDGPRILAHVNQAEVALSPNDRVCLIGQTTEGDPLVAIEETS